MEWHPLRNHGVLPADLPYASNRWVWWKCPNGEDHEWKASPSSRTVGKQGCPFCAGKRVAKDKSLRARLPEIAETWHPTRNGDLTPDRVTAGSRRRVWWRCQKDPYHEWDAIISLRAKRGCPLSAR